MNLILVDDNEIFREDLKTYLELELGHTIIAEAASGEEFLGLKSIPESDLILMDINMRKVDGFQATQKILDDYPYLKIIAVTLDIKPSFLKRIIESGFKGFINKENVFNTIKSTLFEVAKGDYCFPKELLRSI